MKLRICFLILFTQSIHVQAQKGEVVAATIGAGAAIFAAAAAYEAFIEKLENEATEWVLMNRPECKEFQLKLMNLRDEKLTNLSEISSCTFIIKPKEGKEFVLIWIVSEGWWNDFGVNFSRIIVEQFDNERWLGVVKAYFLCASGLKELKGDSIPVYSYFEYEQNAQNNLNKNFAKQPWLANCSFPKLVKMSNGSGYRALQTVTNLSLLKSVSGKKFEFNNLSTPEAPYVCDFDKLDGDSYVVRDFDGLRVVYNERSMNIYFEKINSLIKFRNSVFENITQELLNLPE
jgi:hypothetical protein